MASLMGNAEVPSEAGKSMCACMSCKLVKTYNQFVEGGCENCEWLNMAGDRDRVTDSTTVNFTGLIAIVDPPASWSAKWQHALEEMNQQVPTDYSTIPDLKWKDSFLGLNTMQNIVRLWKNA